MSDYLSEQEQLERLKTWWRENGATLLASCALAVAGVIGWRWYDSAQTAEVEAASELYASYLSAAGDERESLARRLDTELPDSAYRAFSLFHRAREAVDGGDIEGAIGWLQAVIAADVDPLVQDLARVRLARLRQQQGDAEAALATLAEVRGQGYRRLVQELKGDIHLAAGERGLAHEAYASALSEAGENQQRRILEMKRDDTAPPGPS